MPKIHFATAVDTKGSNRNDELISIINSARFNAKGGAIATMGEGYKDKDGVWKGFDKDKGVTIYPGDKFWVQLQDDGKRVSVSAFVAKENTSKK